MVLLVAQWGRLRLPVACEVLDPKRKGHQNILFRQMLRRFKAPAWCKRVVVLADAGFASRSNLRMIQRLNWHFVFALARTWKLADGTHLRDLAAHLPKSRYRRIASYTPEKRRRDYWVFVRRAKVKILGDVTVLLSKRRRNDGPKHVKLIAGDGLRAVTALVRKGDRSGSRGHDLPTQAPLLRGDLARAA